MTPTVRPGALLLPVVAGVVVGGVAVVATAVRFGPVLLQWARGDDSRGGAPDHATDGEAPTSRPDSVLRDRTILTREQADELVFQLLLDGALAARAGRMRLWSATLPGGRTLTLHDVLESHSIQELAEAANRVLGSTDTAVTEDERRRFRSVFGVSQPVDGVLLPVSAEAISDALRPIEVEAES